MNKNQFNNILKLLIITILLPVFIYVTYVYLGTIIYYYQLYIIDNSFYLNLLLIFYMIINIIYEIITIHIINKFSLTNKKPNVHKYVPSYIKNKILLLYEISQFNELNKYLTINILIINILFLIILLLLAIIMTIIFYFK